MNAVGTVDSSVWTRKSGCNREPFQFTGSPGLKFSVDEQLLDFLKLFLTDDLIDIIVTETNRYADQYRTKHLLKPRLRVQEWKPTDSSEIHVFLGLLYLQGIIHKSETGQCFSRHYLLDTPSFYQSMTELHFSVLQRFLHFVDNELLVGEGEKTRKLLKLKPIMDKFRDKFKELYIPERDVSVDESLMLWKGRLAFKQYIQSNELGLESSPTSYASLKVATYGILWCILELPLILVLQFLICLMLTELLCLFCNHCWIKVTIFLS